MVTINLKADPMRIGWYTPEDIQYNSLELIRWRIAMRPHSWRPPTDVYETEDALVVRVEVAGMQASGFSISLDKRNLQIHGNRPDNSERGAFHQMEIPFGEFCTELELPYDVTAEQVEAVYRDGFLRVVLPKAAPHSIHIKDREDSGS
jgi:HSP20 family protein